MTNKNKEKLITETDDFDKLFFTGISISTDGIIQNVLLRKSTRLKDMQNHVGGQITVMPCSLCKSHIMLVDEEAMLKEPPLEINYLASRMTAQRVQGNVLMLKFEDWNEEEENEK